MVTALPTKPLTPKLDPLMTSAVPERTDKGVT